MIDGMASDNLLCVGQTYNDALKEKLNDLVVVAKFATTQGQNLSRR